MEQLNVIVPKIILKSDNQAALKVIKDKKYNSKTRHLGAKTAFIRHYIKNGTISVEYVSTDKNLADGFTKPLGPKKFEEYVRSIGLGECGRILIVQ